MLRVAGSLSTGEVRGYDLSLVVNAGSPSGVDLKADHVPGWLSGQAFVT
jgi:hypothetical protein